MLARTERLSAPPYVTRELSLADWAAKHGRSVSGGNWTSGEGTDICGR